MWSAQTQLELLEYTKYESTKIKSAVMCLGLVGGTSALTCVTPKPDSVLHGISSEIQYVDSSKYEPGLEKEIVEESRYKIQQKLEEATGSSVTVVTAADRSAKSSFKRLSPFWHVDTNDPVDYKYRYAIIVHPGDSPTLSLSSDAYSLGELRENENKRMVGEETRKKFPERGTVSIVSPVEPHTGPEKRPSVAFVVALNPEYTRQKTSSDVQRIIAKALTNVDAIPIKNSSRSFPEIFSDSTIPYVRHITHAYSQKGIFTTEQIYEMERIINYLKLKNSNEYVDQIVQQEYEDEIEKSPFIIGYVIEYTIYLDKDLKDTTVLKKIPMLEGQTRIYEDMEKSISFRKEYDGIENYEKEKTIVQGWNAEYFSSFVKDYTVSDYEYQCFYKKIYIIGGNFLPNFGFKDGTLKFSVSDSQVGNHEFYPKFLSWLVENLEENEIPYSEFLGEECPDEREKIPLKVLSKLFSVDFEMEAL